MMMSLMSSNSLLVSWDRFTFNDGHIYSFALFVLLRYFFPEFVVRGAFGSHQSVSSGKRLWELSGIDADFLVFSGDSRMAAPDGPSFSSVDLCLIATADAALITRVHTPSDMSES